MDTTQRPIFLLLALAGTTMVLLQGGSLALEGTTEHAGPDASVWIQTGKLTPDDAHEPGLAGRDHHSHVHFGSSIDADGDTLVVGTKSTANAGPATPCIWGEPCPGWTNWAYVFERNNEGEWEQVAKLEPHDDVLRTAFGFAVSVHEEAGLLAVGDPGHAIETDDGTLVHEAGALYIYERNALGGWEEAAMIEGEKQAPREDQGILFADDVDVGPDLVIAGSPRFLSQDSASEGSIVAGEGKVSVFERGEDGAWTKSTDLQATDATHETLLGRSVALAEETIIAGAPNADTPDGTISGAAYLFQKTSQGWKEAGKLHPPDPSEGNQHGAMAFGNCVVAEEGVIVVADQAWDSIVDGLFPNHHTIRNTGKVYVFEDQGGSWELTGELQHTEATPNDFFGHALAIDDGTIVVGAPQNGGPGVYAGSAHVFEKTALGWQETGKLYSDEISPNDWAGQGVGITKSTALVGAPLDDNRRDGTSPPLSDHGSPVVPFTVPAGTSGHNAGSVFAFERVDPGTNVPEIENKGG